MTDAVPLADPRDEAVRILEAARARGIVLRATGGIAVSLLAPSAGRPPLDRSYKDVDLVGVGRARREIDGLLRELGYEADEPFNLLHGRERLLYRDVPNGRQLDVFLDRIVMCHALEVADRLDLFERTLPPADLLLTKLQVVQTNERDLKDAIALLLDADVDDERVAQVVSADWGWWRTVTETLGKVEGYAASLDGFDHLDELRARVAGLRARIEAEPKSLRWKGRARVGERVRWYELPEEEQ